MRTSCLLSLCAGAILGAPALAAEPACEQSESTVTPAPKGQLAASVQHQVCATASGGVAAAVTVFVGEAAAPLRGERVVAIAVPRSREEWPRVRWRGDAQLEVWVPNLAQVLDSRPAFRDVAVTLRYCGDDPEARADVAGHEARMQQWMEDVRHWAERRRDDPQGAGPRPARPEEPRSVSRPCTDADLAAAPRANP